MHSYPINVSQVSSLKEVKVGVILAHATGRPHFFKLPFSMELILPAIKLAVEKMEKNPSSVLPGVKFVINERDSNCSNFMGPLAGIELYRTKNAHVFLGPACDFAVAPIARYSGRWKVPVVTAGALFPKFLDKTEFKLLTQVLGSFNKVGDIFRSILVHFNWTRIGLMFREDYDALYGYGMECRQTLRPIYELPFSEPPGYKKIDDKENVPWGQYLTEMSTKSRSE